MAGYISPNTVTDGLVLCLDASNQKSYPGSGTTWSDLTGNFYNGTLINGPTFNSANGGSIVFDGTNDYASLGNILNYTSENFTFSYWVIFSSFTSNVANQGPIVLYKGSYISEGYYDQIGYSLTEPTSIFFATNQPNGFQSTQSNSIIYKNNWYNISYVRNGSSIRIYINGTDQTQTAGTHTNPASSSRNFLIATYLNSIYGNFKMSTLLNYNRALSASEILQNYNATKTRFGL